MKNKLQHTEKSCKISGFVLSNRNRFRNAFSSWYREIVNLFCNFFPEALIFVENNNVYDFIILNHKIFVFSFKDSALENINSFVCNNINNDS